MMRQIVGKAAAWITACCFGFMIPLQMTFDAQAGWKADKFIQPTEPVIEADGGVVEAAARSAESEAQETQVETGQGVAEQEAAGQQEVGQGTAGQPEVGQGTAGQQEAGQGAAGQPEVGQGTAGQQEAGQGAVGQPEIRQEASQPSTGQQPQNQQSAEQQPAGSQQTGTLSGPEISSPSAILMEASTGQVIYEKNADEKRSPASITKIMTLILIFDALESGKIQMTDEVATSAYAKSMGGSQVFLEEGEVQTVETLIKCIVVASGNDASVAMAEYIAGDEKTFVDMMNQRAQGLGMTSTHFEDCCGLTESLAHVTSARDIAIMSRELINHYPQIHNYSTIWMDTITHVTKQGTKEFGLSNTNKLLKMTTNYNVTGLKTGSTSIAKYCLSATAEKDGVRLIAAVMAAPDYRVRFADANTLLNYGYANCKVYEDKEPPMLPMMTVDNGVEEQVPLQYAGVFSYLGLKGEDFSKVERNLALEPSLPAPVELGQKAGALEYWLNGEKLGEISVVTTGSVEAASYRDYFKKMLRAWYNMKGNPEKNRE